MVAARGFSIRENLADYECDEIIDVNTSNSKAAHTPSGGLS